MNAIYETSQSNSVVPNNEMKPSYEIPQKTSETTSRATRSTTRAFFATLSARSRYTRYTRARANKEAGDSRVTSATVPFLVHKCNAERSRPNRTSIRIRAGPVASCAVHGTHPSPVRTSSRRTTPSGPRIGHSTPGSSRCRETTLDNILRNGSTSTRRNNGLLAF